MGTSCLSDDLDSLPSRELKDQLPTLNAHITAALYRFLILVRTLDARMAWAEVGMRSMAHWLNWRCGIDIGTAREQVRVARALGGLPQTSAALAAGTLSYSKVRAMTRVACAATESSLLNIAEYGTASQMEKTVRLIKQGMAIEDPDRLRAMVERCECDWAHDEDGMLVFRARLMPDDGARLVKALGEGVAGTAGIGSVRGRHACGPAACARIGRHGRGGGRRQRNRRLRTRDRRALAA